MINFNKIKPSNLPDIIVIGNANATHRESKPWTNINNIMRKSDCQAIVVSSEYRVYYQLHR